MKYINVEFVNGYIFKTPFYFEVLNYWKSRVGDRVVKVWVD